MRDWPISDAETFCSFSLVQIRTVGCCAIALQVVSLCHRSTTQLPIELKNGQRVQVRSGLWMAFGEFFRRMGSLEMIDFRVQQWKQLAKLQKNAPVFFVGAEVLPG